MVMACCAEWRHRCRSSSSSLASSLAAWFACAAGGMPSSRYTVDDALNKCGTWDAFHWLMLFYCGLSWMCDVSHWAQGSGAPLHMYAASRPKAVCTCCQVLLHFQLEQLSLPGCCCLAVRPQAMEVMILSYLGPSVSSGADAAGSPAALCFFLLPRITGLQQKTVS